MFPCSAVFRYGTLVVRTWLETKHFAGVCARAPAAGWCRSRQFRHRLTFLLGRLPRLEVIQSNRNPQASRFLLSFFEAPETLRVRMALAA